MKTVLVTGGAGFLGSHLCEAYLRKSYRVISVDNHCTGEAANSQRLKRMDPAGDCFLAITADVSLPWASWFREIPSEWLNKLEFVFHLASPASPPHYRRLMLETLAANSQGLSQALDFATLHQARLVYASSSEVYGLAEVHPQNESYWGHVNSFGERSCYTEAKRFGEALLFSYNRARGTRHGLVRIFNTYGPRMSLEDGRIIINALVNIARGQAVPIYGDGSQTRSFCFVDDLMEGLQLYAATDLTEPVNLGNPHEIRIQDLVEALYSLFPGVEKNLQFHPPLMAEDPTRRCPDIEKARRLLQWSPRTPLSEGLKRMKEWLSQCV